ncbi:MAG: hypothetical protein A3H52_00040 [Candidatus Zambryskibacteria bacterium RIFCSPLOWO2_02_FULL_39_26]|uniref:Ig-like domain-containing protein n=1 Tax=Candidatus Zambryskibacteria bacterium RIFCSPLOWO2_12_FULL_39_23 TaxID=1802776 RepID=A0A1G2USG5_9BACT|nr:MAG: hypothetical protein A2W51_01885 [Candidatus Zambryskibacteria bacterium RIFCSPHIGHO2_02_39_10]OHA99727.1 MAG: hypothetical protein A3E59_00770 [Candidatus Zambryskibacteria bacterium RIFCSPHIGHO2_12_FULL_39_47]OHB10159.1 MAG: hypothetical protein A3H52_00040 [Candidatus Zambryskibacteria bacterium RIFCSPLOWO2_02_FULL_39_26]OHB12300.1 MAG: hypothetical protein A3G99_00300 [Candidatus Zambryskibacteria bacterium RIFCSPLOWO2_12_FULL_39_23]
MKYSWYMPFLLVLFAVFFTFDARGANAQIGDFGQSEINVEITPETPGPNEVVYVTLTSYLTNINAATITWMVNGKTINKGVGEKTFQFTVGDMNTTTTLDVVINTAEGQAIEKTVQIKPTSVDLIWQSGGYTPPFYKGKSLFAHQNSITFIAIPHIIGSNGGEISPKNLIYKWKLNGSVKDSSSGYGKNSYTMTGSLISRPLNVEVEVTSPADASLGYARTVVAPITPTIVFYKKDPLYGIGFQDALFGTEILQSKEMAIVGVPFFFSAGNQYELQYKWSINGVAIDNDTTQTTRVFRQNKGVSGTSNIGLSVEHLNKILQFSSVSFDLMFGENTTPITNENE